MDKSESVCRFTVSGACKNISSKQTIYFSDWDAK
jgi:hypothetical protein